jgi:phosphoenolpyruvate---glycerone phosphotransferase subunit DhaL
MAETFESGRIVQMLLGATDAIKANHQRLSQLDSVTGDGDHGAAMSRVADSIAGCLAAAEPGETLRSLLDKVGWAVMGIDGGSTGPLMGSFLSGMAEAVENTPMLDGLALATMFNQGLKKVQELTPAKVGDKTMIDALAPAVERFAAATKAGLPAAVALEQASAAASDGAAATENMRARFGRARNLGDRTLGHVDPGATSIALIFRGFCDAFRENQS